MTDFVRYQPVHEHVRAITKLADEYAELESTDAHARFVALAVHLVSRSMDIDVLSEADKRQYFKDLLESIDTELDDWLPGEMR